MRQGYMKNDGEIGYRELNTIPSKFWNENYLDFEKLEKNKIKIIIFLDRIQIINDDNEIEFDTGEYHKYYLYHTKKEDKKPEFYRKMLRILSIHTLCLGEVFPFVFIGKWKGQWLRIPIDKSLESISIFNTSKKWQIVINDVDLLKDEIPQQSVLENAIIWYTFGKMSKTHLESFMSYYRCIEIFSNYFLKEIMKKVNKFVKDELDMFKKIKHNTFNSILRKDIVSSFLEHNQVENSIIQKIKEFRNKIAHGHGIELEFNNNLIRTEREISNIAYELICKEIQKRKIKKIINPDFQRDYNLYINEVTKEIKLFDSEIFDDEDWDSPYSLKQLGAWNKEEINNVLKSSNIDNGTKEDVRYYLQLIKEGKYKPGGDIFRKMK